MSFLDLFSNFNSNEEPGDGSLKNVGDGLQLDTAFQLTSQPLINESR